MRVGIIQSNYIPWRGYFDFINTVDLFVFLDDVQFTKRDWRTRNYIKTEGGIKLVSVPIVYKDRGQLINETAINYESSWIKDHLNALFGSYNKTPHFKTYIGQFEEILRNNYLTISQLNRALCEWIMKELDIKTPLKFSSEFSPTGHKTDRLVDILIKANAKTYLTGPSAMDYLEFEKFKNAEISLEVKSYNYPVYPQKWDDFQSGVTVLDLLFNLGEEAKDFITSQTPNEVIF